MHSGYGNTEDTLLGVIFGDILCREDTFHIPHLSVKVLSDKQVTLTGYYFK